MSPSIPLVRTRPLWPFGPLTLRQAEQVWVVSFSSTSETGTMARLLRHRQTKETETDTPSLTRLPAWVTDFLLGRAAEDS